MAKFSDLVFKGHPVDADATRAWFDFPNGYAISVITGKYAYTNAKRPYEIAILLNDGFCYDTPITDDVLGYQTADDVTKTMALVAALPKPKE